MTTEQKKPRRKNAPAETDPTATPSTARKLTEEQQRTLIELLAKHHWSDIVREEMAELDPDFPSLTDQTLHYYRTKIRAGEYEWLPALMAKQDIYAPLTTRESRVRFLVREYRRLEQYQPFHIVGVSVVNVSAERRAILAQIAKEMGQDRPNPAPGGLTQTILNMGGTVNATQIGDEAQLVAAEAVMDLVDALVGMREAEAGSVRPADTDDPDAEWGDDQPDDQAAEG